MARLHGSKKAAPPTGTIRQWCGCLTFFAKCGILNFEGIPETVGGLFLLPLLIGTDGRWLHWIVLLHFVICWKSERFWFLWQHLSLHCIKNMATVITRRKRNNRPWSSPTCDGYSITYSQMGADRLLVCSLYFYYTRFLLVCQVCFCLTNCIFPCEKQDKLWFDIFRVVWYNKKPRAYLKR